MNRCKKFYEALSQDGFAAALIHRRENVRYLTGYTGEGALFVSENCQAILTDFRYVEQAGREAPECICLRTGAGETEKSLVVQLASEHHVDVMALETDYISHEQFLALEQSMPGVTLKPLGGICTAMRMVKDEEEIASIREAARISCKAFDRILKKLKPGMTERQVQMLLDYEMLSLGSEERAFDTIAAAGINGSLPHAKPSEHVIERGEMLTLDFGATIHGYKSDMTRTVAFGSVPAELKAMYYAVLRAQEAALSVIRPGAVCGDIDKVARDPLERRYPGAFGHSLGHGVGLFIHEQPRLATGSQTVLVPGNVVTVEPGVYIQGLGGCRIEDMAILTSDGFVNPITSPKQLIEL